MNVFSEDLYKRIINEIADWYIEFVKRRDEALCDLPDDDPLIKKIRNEYIISMENMDDGQFLILIGDVFRRGEYVRKDIDMAVSCYQMAIEKGEMFGHVCLAQIYLTENHYKKDINEIYGHLMEAQKADSLSATGLYMLGNIHFLGLMGETDCIKAQRYFAKVVEDEYEEDDYYWKAFYRVGQTQEIIGTIIKNGAIEKSGKTFDSEDDIENALNEYI